MATKAAAAQKVGGKKALAFVVTRQGKAPAKPAQPADTLEAVKLDAKALQARLQLVSAPPESGAPVDATPKQARAIRRLSELRAARAEIEREIDELDAPLRAFMRECGASELTCADGRYCRETVSATVRVYEAGERFILRS